MGSRLYRNGASAALGFAILLLAYAALGGAAGVLWLIDLVDKLVTGPPTGRPFISALSVNLLFVPIAGGWGVGDPLLLRCGARTTPTTWSGRLSP